jgi:hypothetical protein
MRGVVVRRGDRLLRLGHDEGGIRMFPPRVSRGVVKGGSLDIVNEFVSPYVTCCSFLSLRRKK